MTQVKRQQVVSAPSHLLTNEENAILTKALGPRCPSLATAVVQIYMSDSASGKYLHTVWKKRVFHYLNGKYFVKPVHSSSTQ